MDDSSPDFKPTPWNDLQKNVFHNTIVAQIITGWGQGVRFYPTGKNPFLRKYKSTGLKFTIDIRRVSANPHWKVNVRKVSKYSRFRSRVDWGSKTLLITANTKPVEHDRRNAKDMFGYPLPGGITRQATAPHEFGHMIGYRTDDYKNMETYNDDFSSMMNVGSQLRKRYFNQIDEILDKMVILTDFDVKIENKKS